MTSQRYPVPKTYPQYEHKPRKVDDGRRLSLWAVVDSGFIILAVVLATWLALLLIAGSVVLSPRALVFILLFWLVVTYLLLPRLHQIFSLIYVPDYFIGRTKTYDGLLGDPLNLALDGEEADIHAAMRAAGWTLADPITLKSSWKIAVATLFSRSYPHAPVSDLFLFGRSQDFAYQQEVDGRPHQRHHVRFWKVPDGWVLPGGHRAQWLAAATYDKSVGLSVFTLQVTHKIDENIDAERDYLINTLRYADPQVQVRVIEDFSTAYHHRNGGGDRVKTDGHLPVVNLRGAQRRASLNFNVLMRPVEEGEGKRVSDHGFPPKSLLGTGVLVAMHILAVALIWRSYWLADTSVWEELRADDWASIVGLTVGTCLEVVLWVLTLMRFSWARLALMAYSTLVAVQSLVDISFQDVPTLRSVFIAILAVTVMLILSGNSARQWVSEGKKDPR
ncbi:MAG: LssY C-terminal domain-containing protein [Actinomycetaceae bacterium]|nr:LssY C-terminal domain-containing protein [Actinomycetaceae bacterium]